MLSKKKTTAAVPEITMDQLAGSGTLRNEIAARWKLCETFYGPWDKESQEDYDFALGNQWAPEDRQALKDESRPCLTFNRIKPIINIVSGYQRENSPRIKVNPEGGEDKKFSEAMDKAISFIDKNSDLSFWLNYQFDDGIIAGKSFLEGYKTYEKDPVRGELKFQLLGPSQVRPDPEFKGYDLNDGCGYCFKGKKYSKRRLIELFPDKESIIKGFKVDTDNAGDNIDLSTIEGTNDDYANRPNKTTTTSGTMGEGRGANEDVLDDDLLFMLKEYWRFKRVTRYYVIDKQDMEPKKFEKKELADTFAEAQGSDFKVITRRVNEMWVADMCCGVILQDIVSPELEWYDGYPFFRFIADWTPNASSEVLRTQGMPRQLKDPQREKNKAKSQSLHILNTQANSGWVADEDALTPDDFRKLEKMGSKPGIIVKKKKGSEMREIQAKTQNQGMLVREQQADEEFYRISNINPDVMGMQENKNMSGKAMQTRIRQSIVGLSRLFSNYRYTKKIVGNYILAIMPSIIDAAKLEKILGTAYMQSAGLNKGHLEAYLTMIKDDKYNVMVAEADSQATVRFETFQELLELAKTGSPIPPDLFIDYMDINNSDEVKGRVQAYQQQVMAAEAAKNQKSTPA